MNEDDNFYVVLPSNASTDIFPNNTQSHFRVRLRHPLQLYGSWEVGVAEIHMPLNWFNVDEDNDSLELTWPDAPRKRPEPRDFDFGKLEKETPGILKRQLDKIATVTTN